MADIKIRKPGAGFYLLSVSLLLSIAAFIMYSLTYDALGYASDKWVIASMVIAFWCFGCLLLMALLSANAPKITDVFYWVAVIALTLATFKFLIPCLSPIGIYFTVHNMGDVEANAIGVPRSIVGIILFVLAIVVLIVAAFFSVALKSIEEKLTKMREKVNCMEEKIKRTEEKAKSTQGKEKVTEEKLNRMRERLNSLKEQLKIKEEKLKSKEEKRRKKNKKTDAATSDIPKKICASCGAEIVDYAKFCDKCGSAVAPEEQAAAPEDSAAIEQSEVDHAQ